MEANSNYESNIGNAFILLCVHDGETLVRTLNMIGSFESLSSCICEQWEDIKRDNIQMFYNVPEFPKVMLHNEMDFKNMVSLVRSFGLNRVRIDISGNDKFPIQNAGPFKNPSMNQNGGPSETTSMNQNDGSFENTSMNQNAGLSQNTNMNDDDDDGEHDALSICPLQMKMSKMIGWEKEVSEVGQKFVGGAKEFRIALLKSSIQAGFEYNCLKNDTARVTAICSLKEGTGCAWNVHASIEPVNGSFYVRRINNVHTCGSSVDSMKRRRVSSELISRLIVDEVRDKVDTRPIDVMKQFKSDYGLNISYDLAWNGLEKAKKCLFGDRNYSFDHLRWYVDTATKTNPGSHIVLNVDESSDRFRRFFVSFKACIDGFNFCRPLLFLDRAHLKAKFTGELLSATGIDGNEGLYPFAFAIVDSENEDNWLWFLDTLKEILLPFRNLTFISDRNLDLLGATSKVFPNSHHAYCLNNLEMNLRDKFSGRRCSEILRNRLVRLLRACADAPTVELFEVKMSELLNEGGLEAQSFFENLDVSHWTNAHFKGNRYGEIGSNPTESFNNWISKEMNLPITDLVDSIRVKTMKYFCDRREMCKDWRSPLCPAIESRLSLLMEARTWHVVVLSETRFDVLCAPSAQVDILERTCSCRQWQMNGLPCSHAIVCILKDGRPLHTFVDRFFHSSSFAECYAMPVNPIPTFGYRPKDFLKGNPILPPITERSPQRPKKRTVLSRDEHTPRCMTCSRCGRVGNHNKKTCTAPLV